MNLLNVIFLKFKKSLWFVLILGVFNSLLNGGLLVFISNTISGKEIPFFNQNKALVFVAIILSSLICSKLFQTYMVKLTNNLLFDFELSLLNKLKFSSFTDFQKLGSENVYTAINDTKTLAFVPEAFMNAFNSLIIILCCFAYLIFISPVGAIVVVFTMGLLLVFYIVRNKKIEDQLNKLRDLQNIYYRYIQDLVQGFKELKMGANRNNNIFEHFLIKNRRNGRDISVKTSVAYNDNELTGIYSWYVIFGLILFILPLFVHFDASKTTIFLVTILYLMGPVAIMITLIPTYTAIKIAVERLNVFDRKISFLEIEGDQSVSEEEVNGFRQIEFNSVGYSYYANASKEQLFTLDAINLKIEKGELIFVTGGNGSGKSTFGYLLSGLFKPDSGKILLNNIEIQDGQEQLYRDYISAIFTDNHLFNENYDQFDLSANNEELVKYIRLMKMEDVIKLDAKTNKISNHLSKGQRKRLALIYVLLENKPLLVLDEWAAEQDPLFRNYFYKEILPELGRMGKTIIAITHDDEYYAYASRVVKFNYGKIVSDERILVSQ